MAIRDLGYQPYEGERQPPSNNIWVLMRYGMRRAWASWLVKIAAFCVIFPLGLGLIYHGVGYAAVKMSDGQAPLETFAPERILDWVFWSNTWLLVAMVTLGAGAGAISEDFKYKAFQFYFSKPVTPAQYLTGRVVAVALFLFLLCVIPASLVAMVAAALPLDQLKESTLAANPDAVPSVEEAVHGAAWAWLALRLQLQAIGYAAVLAIGGAITSVSVSSLSKSRALTMSAWVLFFIVPFVLALVIEKAVEWPWLYLLSLPGLFSRIGMGILQIAEEEGPQWFHALGVLAALCAGGLYVAYYRLRKSEVIT
jgi:ABC-type transport system involved in multi-copper enzyme maturation permease subunit